MLTEALNNASRARAAWQERRSQAIQAVVDDVVERQVDRFGRFTSASAEHEFRDMLKNMIRTLEALA